MNSAVAVRSALKERGLPTSTPGMKGEERHCTLRQRLLDALEPTINTARSVDSTSTTSSTSTSRPPRSITAATITALKAALESRNLDTHTPRLRGEERKNVLEQRLADDMYLHGEVDEEAVSLDDVTPRSNDSSGIRSSRGSAGRNGSYTARESTPSSSSSSNPTTSRVVASTSSRRERPSSAPLEPQQRNARSSRSTPWAVRTRVGRGRGRSRGACRGVGRRGGRGAATSGSRDRLHGRQPLAEKKNSSGGATSRSTSTSTTRASATPRGSTPRGTRGQPPVSARLTARMTAVESLHTEASEELRDAELDCERESREAQRLREEAACLRGRREAAVARRSDPSRNHELGGLVENIGEVREELKELYAQTEGGSRSNSSNSSSKTHFESNVLGGGRRTISVAFKELEATERSLDDEIDTMCSRIVVGEEKSKEHGVDIEEELLTEAEKAMVRAGRLKRMLPTLLDRERMAKQRMENEFERRSQRPPHPGMDAVKDPVKLAKNADFLWQVRDDVDTADRIFSQALSRSPDNSLILHLYATFLHKSSKKEHAAAARMWQRAVLLSPRNADILAGYGTLLHRTMCRPDDAKPLILRALASDPTHATALLANALLLQSKRDYEESKRNFIEARERDPESLPIVTHYANFLKKCMGQYKEAEEMFELGMRLNPCDADHLGAYAQFMFKVRGNTNRADGLFIKAIEADPEHWHNLSRHANMLKKTGRYVFLQCWDGWRKQIALM